MHLFLEIDQLFHRLTRRMIELDVAADILKQMIRTQFGKKLPEDVVLFEAFVDTFFDPMHVARTGLLAIRQDLKTLVAKMRDRVLDESHHRQIVWL